MLGSSVIPFPHPVNELKDAKRYGTLVYDASHVLGLIAGEEFQDPLGEGADIMIGSTHKTFPGPQGGIVLTDSEEKAETIEKMLKFDFEEGIGLIDNPHVHRIAAIGIVLEEMLSRGKEYARQVIRNARELASSLNEHGIPVKFPDRRFTSSHQILLDFEQEDAIKFCRMLEEQNIFVDISGRIGVAEVTHIGMKEQEMRDIAGLIADAYHGKDIRERVKKWRRSFMMHGSREGMKEDSDAAKSSFNEKTDGMLTERDAIRYSRQISIPGFGKEKQRKLKSAKVMVAGAGVGLRCRPLPCCCWNRLYKNY